MLTLKWYTPTFAYAQPDFIAFNSIVKYMTSISIDIENIAH